MITSLLVAALMQDPVTLEGDALLRWRAARNKMVRVLAGLRRQEAFGRPCIVVVHIPASER